MHWLMIGLAFGIAIGLRGIAPQVLANKLLANKLLAHHAQSWNRALFLFVFPPLLIMTTTIAVLWMGDRGQMMGLPSGHFSSGVAIALGLWGASCLAMQLLQVRRTLQVMARYPQKRLGGLSVRWLVVDFPYCAQVGFWRSQLLITQGLLDLLSEEQLEAVLAHEQAHEQHRDTFWFIWLNSLRMMSLGLPHTGLLWQELLLLREMRADRQAAQTTDPLLLAESLLLIAQTIHRVEPFEFGAVATVPFHESQPHRLCDRIDALLLPQEEREIDGNRWFLIVMILILIPLITIPFHT
jgi:Zn-dependent protease with chaperone function